jgi:bifunctional non-homologous end joining protein LigD
MVVFDDDGRPQFNKVQLYNGHKTPINYYVFDIIYLDGYDLRALPLEQRKMILKQLVEDNDIIRFSESFDDGEGLYQLMQQKGWEGVIAKKKDSAYIEDDRSNRWLKFPVQKIDEFVIGGWAESDKARSFRSILFGAYDKKRELKWLGRSGGGYKEEEMPGILSKMKKFSTKTSPFVNKVLDTKGAVIHWLKPQLVANFQYSEMTESGRIRKPAIWKNFREDKDPKQVLIPETKKFDETIAKEKIAPNEIKKSVGKKSPAMKTTSRKKKYPYLNKDSGWQKVDEEQKNAEWQYFEMEQCTIPVHNLDRELWEGVPKGQILIYYSEMAHYILPYLKNRPQSLNLKLTHAGAPRTFIKDMENRQPNCSEVFVDKRKHNTDKGKRHQIDYLVCNNRETLIYMTDLGCVDINPWASLIEKINEPDYLSLDLDPTIPDELKGPKRLHTENDGFEKAIQVAIAAKKVFDKYKLTAFIKTSGQTGLHIFIPCSGFKYKQPRNIAFKLAEKMHASVPKISTVADSKDLRSDKVYIDTTLNDYADTLAAVYSIRPYHRPLVSTPLEWKEVKRGLDRYRFTMEMIKERIKRKGDLWEKLFNKKIIESNNKALLKL